MIQVWQEKLDLRVRSDEQDFVVTQERLALLVTWERSVSQESEDVMVNMDLVDQWVPEDLQEHQATQAVVARMESQEMMDQRVI